MDKAHFKPSRNQPIDRSTSRAPQHFVPHKLTMRLAKVEDYKSVMDIDRNISSGYDYLPDVYRHYAHDHSHFQFVAEYDGEVISYRSCKFLDNYDACLGLSARTSPRYQGLRIAEKVEKFSQKYLNEKIRKDTSGLGVYASTIQRRDKIKANPMQSILACYHRMVYHVSYEALVKVDSSLPNLGFSDEVTNSVQKFSLEKSIALVTSDANIEQLYKHVEYILTGNLYPLKLNKSNLRAIVTKYSSFFTVRETSAGSRDFADGTGVSSGKSGTNVVCTALSTVSSNQLQDGSVRINFHYHGNPDVKVCIVHILKQLGDFARRVVAKGTAVTCLLFLPDGVLADAIHDMLLPLLGKDVSLNTKVLICKTQNFLSSKI